MTAKLVDDITETGSDKDRESRGQGIANVITGFFGGMAGCAMIGQTMIDVRAGGARTRLSTFAAGAFLLILVVAGTLATQNLAVGVGAGLLTAMAVFARRVAHLVEVDRVADPDGSSCLYSVHGGVFFASDQELIEVFRYAEDPPHVIVDFSRAHLWDASATAAVDAIEGHFRRHDVAVSITGLNERSDALARQGQAELALEDDEDLRGGGRAAAACRRARRRSRPRRPCRRRRRRRGGCGRGCKRPDVTRRRVRRARFPSDVLYGIIGV